jgi:hypothetical protein
MPRVKRIPIASGFKPPLGRSTNRVWCGAQRIRLYGWDSLSETWSGPNQLGCRNLPDRRLLRALEAAAGKSWYGPVSCRTSGGSSTRFFALVRDLSDCAIASIYCDESKAGPAEILAVIPADRRSHLRAERVRVSGVRALSAFTQGRGRTPGTRCESPRPSRTSAVSQTLVFSTSSGLWSSDCDAGTRPATGTLSPRFSRRSMKGQPRAAGAL